MTNEDVKKAYFAVVDLCGQLDAADRENPNPRYKAMQRHARALVKKLLAEIAYTSIEKPAS